MACAGVSVLRPSTVSLLVKPDVNGDRKKTPMRNHLLVKSTPNVLFRASSRSNGSSEQSSSTELVADPNLSIIDIEARLREKVRQKLSELQQAFQTYDIDESLSVTRGEFRRVIEMYCLSLVTQQFDALMAKISTNPNGTVRYIDFLEKFYGHPPGVSVHENVVANKTKTRKSSINKEQTEVSENIDIVLTMLREKIKKNLKNVMKGFHLFDYNRDGHIQKHELRRLIENYCFKLNDQQFDKIWCRFDYRHTGLLDYDDFLIKLGVKERKSVKTPDSNNGKPGSHQSNNRLSVTPKREKQNGFKCETDGAMTLLEIDREFRKRMRENYADLRRAFLVLDSDLTGFVSLTNLRSVLNSFTVPMNEELFMYIMEKNAFKASGKIAWEIFLEKFQDPQSAGNGQTLPIGEQNHKFFPVRGAQENRSVQQIGQLLWDRVQDGFSSFRKAFLQLDKNRNGKISRRELRKVVESFKIHVTDEQFRDLYILLDPTHSNMIDYHQFLDIFEPKESLDSHKWLKSVHRYNDTSQKPVLLAWDTVEGLLAEKITRNWKEVSQGIMMADKNDEGIINPLDLKKILDKYCLPTTFEHFSSLVEGCSEKDDGRIDYSQFFSRLGVQFIQGDTEGLSSQIMTKNEQSEDKRKDQLQKSMNQFDQNAYDRTSIMTPKEIVHRLRDRMRQHCVGIRTAFQSYDRNNKGKVSKANFKKILESMGFTLSQEQFSSLVELLEFQNGYLDYNGFIETFDDPRDFGLDEKIKRSGNHHVNPIRGDEYGLTADDVEQRLHKKLLHGFSRLRDAFYHFDENHTGFLTKSNFRRMLDSFMLVLDDSEFEKLCLKLDINEKSKVDYKTFLKKFEVQDSAEGHHWISDHRFNEHRPDKILTCDEIHVLLVEKAHRQYSDLARAFRKIDDDGNGVITRLELRGLLYKFVIPTNQEEFGKLWKRYDPQGKGAISHSSFLEKLGAEKFAPDDKCGESRRLIDKNQQKLEAQRLKLIEDQEKIALRQAQRGQLMNVDDLYDLLRLRILDYYEDFHAVFRKYDKKQKGTLSVHEFQQVLTELNLFIRDDQFFQLMDKIGLVTNKSTLNYEEFLKAFEEGRKSAYGQRRPVVQVETNEDMPNLEAESKVREKVAENAEVLAKAFAAMDPQATNRVKASVFRRILDQFCFKMSDAQFKHIMKKIRMNGDDTIDYKTFLTHTVHDQDNSGLAWLDNVQRSVRAKTPHYMSMEEIEDRLKEMVKARVYTFARAFAEIDYAKIGVVAKDDFQRSLHQHAFRLTDSQLDRLWCTLPVNDFGNLDYKEFLSLYCEDFTEEEFQRGVASISSPLLIDKDGGERSLAPSRQLATPRAPSRAVSRGARTPASIRPSSAVFSRRPLTTTSGSRMLQRSRCSNSCAAPLVNAESVEQSLRSVIYRHWKDVQKQCRARDIEDSGYITEMELRDILGRHVSLSDDDIEQLMMKYDVHGSGYFAYVPFLRHFVLTMKSKEEKEEKKAKKKKEHRLATIPGSAGSTHEPSPLQGAVRRLRECVQDQWKDMRRSFRALDKTHEGHVTADEFHTVLKQFTPNLSEDEYFYLLSDFDRDVTGYILYNEFIRVCIQKN